MERLEDFRTGSTAHVAGPCTGNHAAAAAVLSPQIFADAIAEVTSWPGYAPTVLHDCPALAAAIGVDQVLYKDESTRFGLRSFKALGGAYATQRVLAREIAAMTGRPVNLADIRAQRYPSEAAQVTVTCATDGNHGRSVAWGAQRFGCQCVIYIHAEVSAGRQAAIEQFGAEVIRVDGNYDDAVRAAAAEAQAHGRHVVSDTSYAGYTEVPRYVMAGYGLMAREAIDAIGDGPPPTHVMLQGGVGGFPAAIAAYFQQAWGDAAPRAVVVEPDLAACLMESARADALTEVPITEETVMAGLSCGAPSVLAWEVLRAEARDFVAIPDAWIPTAMGLMACPLGEDPRIEAGESAVAGLAALIGAMQRPEMAEKLGLGPNARVLLLGTEGATDPETYRALLAQAA